MSVKIIKQKSCSCTGEVKAILTNFIIIIINYCYSFKLIFIFYLLNLKYICMYVRRNRLSGGLYEPHDDDRVRQRLSPGKLLCE